MKFIFLCLVLLATASGHGDIYRDLWDLDQKHNGLSVGFEGEKEILIDEQEPYQKGSKKDAAKHPLFKKAKSEKIKGATYRTIEKLFDNYNFKSDEPEDELGKNAKEDAERNEFLDAVLKTDVMKQTTKHLKLTDQKMREELTRLWFEPFTNHYEGDESQNCSGFEHVFVGEQSSSTGIGGYHFWYKFFNEEVAKKVDYYGYNYANIKDGEKEPYVATFAMRWDSEHQKPLKEITGFLVGPSPELMLAWGTIAYFDNVRLSATKSVEIPTSIEDTKISIVLHRETKRSTKRDPILGNHIRTFYPRFVGLKK